jgi:tetratricopeptide (TPR) repeat protein
VDDTVRSGWMLRKAAKLRALRLSDARGAVTAYREAVAVNPGDQEAWEALEPLAVELEDDGLLLEALERILTLAKKEAQRAQVALKLGRQRMKMGLVSEAIAAFTLARELARGPLLAQSLEALEGAYRLAGRAEELARVLEERAADGKAPNARDLLLERASLLEERLGRHDLAIECLQKLLTLAPDDARVGSELERLLSGQRRWEELTALYEQQATRRGARGYDALVLLGRVLRDQLDAPERAAKALQRAVALNPAGLEAVEALRDLYTRTEQWSELLDALRLELGLVKGARQRESRLRRAGHLAEEKLGDLLTAARLYAEASQLAPKDKNLLADLARVQEARGDYQGLIETLRRDLALTTEPAKTLELHKRLGQVHAARLFKRQDALECYRQALAVDPTDKDALAALTDLLRDLGAWDELAQVIERRLGAARGKDATLLRLELARVQAEKLGRPDQAIAAAEEVLTDDPRCVEAVMLQVQLHRRFEGRQEGTKKEAKQHDASFARALRRLAVLREGSERAAVLVELAGIQRRSKGDEAARPTLLEAFKADPAHEPALEQLTNLFTPNNQWDELLATLEAAAKAATTEFRRGELLARTAELLEVRRKDPAAAEARYREALALSPTHLPALRGLARALQARGVGLQGGEEVAAEALARLEEQVAELETEPRDKALALVRAGDVRREALGQLPHARRHYELALTRAPELFTALAGLAELAWAQDDVPAALAALERVAASPELAKEPERGAELLWVRGQVLEKARKLEQAAASYRRAVELRPDHLQALEDLGRLCMATEGWAAARGVYEELVGRTRAPRVRAEHQLALARVTGKLGDVDKAVALFEEGLAQVPKHPEGRLGLGELLKAKDPKGARRQFEMALAGAPPAVEVQARLALADLFEGPLADADAAAGHLQAASAHEGAHRARSHRRLAEILGRQERWNDAVHHLTRAAELEPEPRKQAELMANVARVVRDRLKQRKLARKCFHQAFSLNPHDRHTLDSLLRLLEADGDLEAQARALGTAADVAREGRAGDEAALRLRRAEVLVAMKRPKDAAGEYERIMAIEPRHAGSRAALSRLYVEVGDVGGVERIHRELLAEDPLAVESFRALHDVWRAGGRADERAQTAQVLSVLKAATDDEEKLARQSTQKAPSWRGKVNDDAFVDHVLHPRLAGPLGELVRAAREVTTKQVPDDLKSHGIGWLTKSLPLEGDAFPEHRLVKQVAELLDVGTLELYWMADWRRPEPVIGHGRNPGLILCPEVFSGLSEPEKAFVIGRALGPLKVGLEPLRALSVDQLKLVLLGVLKGIDPSRSFKGDDDKLVKAVVKAVGKTELARDLARVHEALWRGREALDLEGLRQAALLCGSRAGLLAAGGLLPAARAVFATNLSLRGRAPETTEAVVKELKDSPELKDLLGWAVSPGHLGLRARLLAGAPAAAGGR